MHRRGYLSVIHRDGQGRTDGNFGGALHYEPNSFGYWRQQPEHREPPLRINGQAAHYDFREDDADYFSQPRALLEGMNAAQRQALFDNTARAMGDAPEFIKHRHIRNCHACHPAYGAGVAQALGLNLQTALASREQDPALGYAALPA